MAASLKNINSNLISIFLYYYNSDKTFDIEIVDCNGDKMYVLVDAEELKNTIRMLEEQE